MPKTVFTTLTARHFHNTPHCRARISAQMLNDWDCGCGDYCSHRSPRLHPVQEIPLAEAVEAGKTPCTACYRAPDLARTVLPPSREDFGHRPVGPSGAQVCARCARRRWVHAGDIELQERISVPWPCTSATILGLAQ